VRVFAKSLFKKIFYALNDEDFMLVKIRRIQIMVFNKTKIILHGSQTIKGLTNEKFTDE